MGNTYTAIQAREIDFVSRFTQNWDALKDIMGISRPIKRESGSTLVSYKATVPNGLAQSPAAGQPIPYTDIKVEAARKGNITIEKYSKACTIEDVNQYGVKVAVEKTDDAFLNELQNGVLNRFYTFINTGSLTGAESTYQMALAMAKAKVIDKFNKIRKTCTEVVGFANVLDVYKYIGAANITVQTMFGIQYVKDFMGYKTLFLLSEPDVARGTVIATPVENIILYYVDPSNADFEEIGLDYRVDGETNLIGIHANGNYGTAVGEVFAVMGMELWAEYLDGIAVITLDDSFLNDLVVESDAAESTYPWTDKTPSDFQSDVAVNGDEVTGTLKFIEGGLASSGPLAGDGYFLALKYSAPTAGVTSLKVGLVPSEGTGLVEAIADTDRNVVMKISDKANQRFTMIQSDGTHTNKQVFSLAKLVLEAPTGV